jgi:hypothetical protein
MNNTQSIAKLIGNCKDTALIPKVSEAGQVTTDKNGQTIQIMHNGVKVLANSYYGDFHTEIIKQLKGHHEPQEEKVFFEVIKKMPTEATMIELGSYWSYYSLWFHKMVQKPKNYMVEALEENLELGRNNFKLNGFDGEFIYAKVGRKPNDLESLKTVSVDYLILSNSLDRVNILHADIQGHEYEMLIGAKEALKDKKIDFIFISTHGLIVHFQCLKLLKIRGYKIIAEHTNLESYSCDGLIVGALNKSTEKVSISKRNLSVDKVLKIYLAKALVWLGLR